MIQVFTNQDCVLPRYVMLNIIAAVETIAVAAHLSVGKAVTVASKNRKTQTQMVNP